MLKMHLLYTSFADNEVLQTPPDMAVASICQHSSAKFLYCACDADADNPVVVVVVVVVVAAAAAVVGGYCSDGEDDVGVFIHEESDTAGKRRQKDPYIYNYIYISIYL